jgi:phospholipase C
MTARYTAVLSLFALAGCASGSQTPLPYMQSAAALRALDGSGAGKITHVVYVVQENRSFDNLFQGYPGADTASSGMNSYGQTITLQPSSLKTVYVIDHSAYAMFAACNGTGSLPGTDCQMNGFNNEGAYGGPQNPEYVYVPHSESKPYFDMAHEWVVGDRMFQSQLDESFVAHQYAIAAQAQSSVDLPYGYWGCKGGSGDLVATITQQRTGGPSQEACFDYETLGDELDAAGIPWRYYPGAPPHGDGYDHVRPKMLDYDGLGFRVPLLAISPYAKQGYVSHVHYELASILRFVENRFGLKRLSASDARATSPAGLFQLQPAGTTILK